MCSYIVKKAALAGSAKGAKGWMTIDTANIYYDHPYHAPFDHALNIDFVNEANGGRERVARRAFGQRRTRARQTDPGSARDRREGARACERRRGRRCPGLPDLSRLRFGSTKLTDQRRGLGQLAPRNQLVADRAQHAPRRAKLDRERASEY